MSVDGLQALHLFIKKKKNQSIYLPNPTLTKISLKNRVKYPICIWVLRDFKFSTLVLFCIIGDTWIKG